MTQPFTTDSHLSDERTRELLDGLEESHKIDVHQARAISTVPYRAEVEVRKGDVAERDTTLTSGNSTELQRSGVSCILTRPVLTGGVFHLTFRSASIELDAQLAVCDRVVMLSDSAFETHFRFAREIDLPADDVSE